MEQVLRSLAEKRGLEPWEKIVNFTKDQRFPSRLTFGNFKGRREVNAENLKLWNAEM
jgi:DNA polymerase-3 subunit epsilon